MSFPMSPISVASSSSERSDDSEGSDDTVAEESVSGECTTLSSMIKFVEGFLKKRGGSDLDIDKKLRKTMGIDLNAKSLRALLDGEFVHDDVINAYIALLHYAYVRNAAVKPGEELRVESRVDSMAFDRFCATGNVNKRSLIATGHGVPRHVFIPINTSSLATYETRGKPAGFRSDISGGHWMLAIASPESGSVEIYNSMVGDHSNNAVAFRSTVEFCDRLLAGKGEERVPRRNSVGRSERPVQYEAAYQNDGSSCGAFVCARARDKVTNFDVLRRLTVGKKNKKIGAFGAKFLRLLIAYEILNNKLLSDNAMKVLIADVNDESKKQKKDDKKKKKK